MELPLEIIEYIIMFMTNSKITKSFLITDKLKYIYNTNLVKLCDNKLLLFYRLNNDNDIDICDINDVLVSNIEKNDFISFKAVLSACQDIICDFCHVDGIVFSWKCLCIEYNRNTEYINTLDECYYTDMSNDSYDKNIVLITTGTDKLWNYVYNFGHLQVTYAWNVCLEIKQGKFGNTSKYENWANSNNIGQEFYDGIMREQNESDERQLIMYM